MFLGLDLSTQQVKAILISDDLNVVHSIAVHFDRDLPWYGTVNGAIQGPGEGEVTSPVSMWLEAIDVLMDRLQHARVDFGAIVAVSGAGQQHGSVYWSADAESSLSSLDANRSLCAQLSPKAFSLPNAPIWQDSSTTLDCCLLHELIGGPQTLADLTGSRAYERFTGPQIAKIRRLNFKAYESTARISLVSSFLCSLFLGRVAPIERSDASGMNLMNILSCTWEDRLLEACGGSELRSKLGPEPVPGGTVLGIVCGWWVKRWGFHPECIVAPFTGDNPATAASLSTAPGDAILSLGTSTTLLLSVPQSDMPPKRTTTSHLLSHPTMSNAHIAMLCYKNGALAREQVRDRYAGGDWTRFNELVEESPAGNNGSMGLYYPLPEIMPANVVGEFLFSTQDTGKPNAPVLVHAIPSTAHPRAILESQFLSIRARIANILPAGVSSLHRLVVTGGTSTNTTVLQLAADVMGMPVYVAVGPENKEAACTGGAMLGRFAWYRQMSGARRTFEEMSVGIGERMRRLAEPKANINEEYEKLMDVYRACEEMVLVPNL